MTREVRIQLTETTVKQLKVNAIIGDTTVSEIVARLIYDYLAADKKKG